MRCTYMLDTLPFDRELGVRDQTPVCGEDFCDSCGDCLACFDADDTCYGAQERSEHSWVRYVTQREWDALEHHQP